MHADRESCLFSACGVYWSNRLWSQREIGFSLLLLFKTQAVTGNTYFGFMSLCSPYCTLYHRQHWNIPLGLSTNSSNRIYETHFKVCLEVSQCAVGCFRLMVSSNTLFLFLFSCDCLSSLHFTHLRPACGEFSWPLHFRAARPPMVLQKPLVSPAVKARQVSFSCVSCEPQRWAIERTQSTRILLPAESLSFYDCCGTQQTAVDNDLR